MAVQALEKAGEMQEVLSTLELTEAFQLLRTYGPLHNFLHKVGAGPADMLNFNNSRSVAQLTLAVSETDYQRHQQFVSRSNGCVHKVLWA